MQSNKQTMCEGGSKRREGRGKGDKKNLYIKKRKRSEEIDRENGKIEKGNKRKKERER